MKTEFEVACYKAGRDRGFEFLRAAIEGYPIGAILEDDTENGDFREGDEVTEDNCSEVWMSLAGDSEDNNRSSGDWTVPRAIREYQWYDEAWEAYEGGISQGMTIALWLWSRGHSLQPRLIYGVPA